MKKTLVAAAQVACLLAAVPTAHATPFGPPALDPTDGPSDVPSAATMAAPGVVATVSATDGGASAMPQARGIRVEFRGRTGATQVVGTGAARDDIKPPVIASDGKGTVTVAWSQSGREVLAAQCTRGGCTPARKLTRPGTDRVGTPSIAADSRGRAVVLWAAGVKNATRRLEYRVIAKGGRPGTLTTLARTASARSGAVAVVGDRFVAAWSAIDGIRVGAVPSAGRVRGRAVRARHLTGSPSNIRIVGAGKEAVLVWTATRRTGAGTAGDAATTTVRPDGTVGRVSPLVVGSGGLTLAAAPTGRAVLLRATCAAIGERVSARLREPGGRFGGWQTLDPRTVGCPSRAGAAVDDQGRVVVGWTTLPAETPTQALPQIATAAPGQSFTPAELLDPTPCAAPDGSCRSRGPLLAAGGTDLFAMWVRNTELVKAAWSTPQG